MCFATSTTPSSIWQQLTLAILLSGASSVEVVAPIESKDGHGLFKGQNTLENRLIWLYFRICFATFTMPCSILQLTLALLLSGESVAEVMPLASAAEVARGISIELYYYGISEPIYHYRGYHMLQKPFNMNDDQHVQKSLFMTFLHWGLHGWCPYIVVAISLSLALFPQSCHMHFGHLYNVLVLVLMGFCLYFVTSSISGSYVDNHVSANGHETSPALQNVHWCWTEGLTAIVLVKTGSDEATKALRTAAFVAFLPCTTAIICFMRTVISRAVRSLRLSFFLKARW